MLPLKCSALAVLIIVGAMAASCADETPLPAYRSDFCEILTDENGQVSQLRRDDGSLYRATAQLNGLRPDTAYRLLVTTLPQADQSLKIVAATPIVAPLPIRLQRAPKMDAISLVTLWRSPRYLNFSARVGKSGTKQHIMGFVEQELTRNPNGSFTLHLAFYHDRAGDSSNYDEEQHFSCPLYPYAQLLHAGRDSIALRLQEPQGLRRFVWPY